ncbi:MAG: hypothetical protein QOC73_1661, partial [Actinomycetota bacterium]|nr:hypothetical protein [Actinomycetota bacterium]
VRQSPAYRGVREPLLFVVDVDYPLSRDQAVREGNDSGVSLKVGGNHEPRRKSLVYGPDVTDSRPDNIGGSIDRNRLTNRGHVPSLHACCFSRLLEQSSLAGEGSGEPEPWEHGVFEAGHGTDPVAGEREDVKADPMADAVRIAEVGAERRLTVGSR